MPHASLLGRPPAGREPDSSAPFLPRWPVAALFVGFPVWWLLGAVDLIWIPMAAVMARYLARTANPRVPRGFGLWMFFLIWSSASAIMLTSFGDVLGFAYRALLYVSGGVLFVYVFNARRLVTQRYVSGTLTCWWLFTVVGGYLGVLVPNGVLRTPLSYLMPGGLVNNELVNAMVIRRFAQYNPDSYLQVAPRPSAPFLYTNNWGNVYSLLLPFVVAYIVETWGERRSRWLLLALPVSAVPAMLTLNRGMFIGIGISVVYAGIRLALLRRFKAVGALALLGVIGFAIFTALPVEERLGNRLSGDAEKTSNDTRASLYLQAIELVPESPVFGFGAPQRGDNPDAAPVGTQGQIWMVLVSHGPVAAACFLGWFGVAFWRSARRSDPVGLASSTALLVGTIEFAYYGILPNGLPILMAAAALGMRPPDVPPAPAPLPSLAWSEATREGVG